MKHTFHLSHERRLIFEDFEVFGSRSEGEKVRNAEDWFKKLAKAAERAVSQEEWNASDDKDRLRGGLVDQSRFLSAGTKEIFAEIAKQPLRKTTDGRGMKMIATRENGYNFSIQIEGRDGKKEIWYLSETRWTYENSSTSVIPFPRSWTVFWSKKEDGTVDKQTQFTLPNTQSSIDYYGVNIDRNQDGMMDFPVPFVFENGQWTLNVKGVEKAIEMAKKHRESELKDAARVREFDIPRNEDVGYISLYHNKPSDDFLRVIIDDARYFPELLKQCGYRIRQADAEAFIPLSERSRISPEEAIRARLQKLYKDGIRIFYINTFAHGTGQGMDFGSGELRPDHLHRIFDEYRDCRFVVNTVACWGGQLERALWDYKDPSGVFGRVRLFLPSQITAPNLGAEWIGEGNPYTHKPLNRITSDARPTIGYSTYYHIFLVHYLLQGKKYGEAHWLADQHIKAILGTANAQSWASTPEGGVNTAMRRRDEEKNRPA